MQPALSILNQLTDAQATDEQTPTIRLAVIRALKDGYPCIHWPGCPDANPVKARTQVKVSEQDIGRECSFALIENNPSQPLVLGLLYRPDRDADGPVVIQSDQAVTLQAGHTRIELHADGRIQIRGLHIDTQAYGPNRIKGAAVKIN